MQKKVSAVAEIPATAQPLNANAQVASSIAVGQDAVVSAGYQAWPNEIEFTLPDGRTICMRPPKASLSRLTAGILAETKLQSEILMQVEVLTVNALCFIYSIDGRVLVPPADPNARDFLEQEIGPRWVDVIVQKYMENFPSVNAKSIPIIKK